MPFLSVSFLVGRVPLLKQTTEEGHQLILSSLLEELFALLACISDLAFTADGKNLVSLSSMPDATVGPSVRRAFALTRTMLPNMPC